MLFFSETTKSIALLLANFPYNRLSKKFFTVNLINTITIKTILTNNKKSTEYSVLFSNWQLPILPARLHASTFGL